jgi:short-subunit dehydrogenase
VLEHGRFVDLPATTQQGLIDLNVSGLTSLLSHFLPPMVARGKGRILNVASIAAFQPVPSLATYAATKAYVLSLSESLAEELSGTGVSVTALCPGVTATNMVSNVQEKSSGLKIPSFIVGDVEEVAELGYRACLKGDVICVPGAVNRAATFTGRATPKWLLRRISGVMGRYTLRK